MLDPWIIEEILKREEERRREQEQVRIELPIEIIERPTTSVTPPREENERGRGVMIIDI